MSSSAKLNGLVLTPAPIAQELVSWAVSAGEDTVLDIGSGEGVFLSEAVRRLRELGCGDHQIRAQVFGVERDPSLYNLACAAVAKEVSVALPQFINADLFETEFPPICAIVGNPPYVRRNTLTEIDRVRERVALCNPFLAHLPRLTDLYSYFLIYASQFLRPGGRIGVIVSSSWMDTRYGEALKHFLLRSFAIRILAVTEARLFSDALVKPVMILAEKTDPSKQDAVKFVRAREFIPGLTKMTERMLREVAAVHTVRQADLDHTRPWGIYVRSPVAYSQLPPEKCLPLGRVAKSRIGIQPLARNFYILDTQVAKGLRLPEEFLRPLVFSPRTTPGLVVQEPQTLPHRVLFVKEKKDKIPNENVRRYIAAAEKTRVSIRGKNETVVGYHRVPRLERAGRQPWYNLADDIVRRGCYSILVPRRFYENFVVLWNKARAVANENFIEVEPLDKEDLLPLLAILNSSFFEFACRSRAQQYGGGVFNLNPLDVQEIPVLSPRLLDANERKSLGEAYIRFTKGLDRGVVDAEIGRCFEIPANVLRNIRTANAELRQLCVAAKKVSRLR